MPQSKKGLRKLKQKQNEENGVVYEKKAPEKYSTCTICKIQIRVTKTNTEIKQHVDSKHAQTGIKTCFPDVEM